LAPFGVGNEEPLFLLQSLCLQKIQKVWSRWAWHLKFQARFQDRDIECLFRGKGDQIDSYSPGQDLHCVWRIKKDTFKSGYYVDGVMTETPG
jgi:single-stranded DNA-specific DHH superfamily exonuclease